MLNGLRSILINLSFTASPPVSSQLWLITRNSGLTGVSGDILFSTGVVKKTTAASLPC